MSKRKIKIEIHQEFFPIPNDIFDMKLNPSEIVLYILFIKFDVKNNGYCHTDFSTIKGYITLSDKTIKNIYQP